MLIFIETLFCGLLLFICVLVVSVYTGYAPSFFGTLYSNMLLSQKKKNLHHALSEYLFLSKELDPDKELF